MTTTNPELERLREEARKPDSGVIEVTYADPAAETTRQRQQASFIYLMREDGMVEIIKNKFDEVLFTDWGGLHRLLIVAAQRGKQPTIS